MRALVVFLLLCSCSSLIPDEVSIAPVYGEGVNSRVGSTNSARSDFWAVEVRGTWNLNANRSSMWRNLGGLDIDRVGRMQVHDHEAHTGEAPVVTVHTGDAVTDGGDGALPVSVDDLPTTWTEGLGWLFGAAGIALLIWAWSEAKNRKRRPKDEETTKP